MNQSEIKLNVASRYGALARRALESPDTLPIVSAGSDACCGDECCTPAAPTQEELTYIKGLYAEEQVAGLPEGAIEAAAGCGNPTAIAELRPGEVVLDLGSGGGIDCFLAARQVGPEGRVIGVDMTPEMVELARRNARELGASNVTFKLGEIEALPIPDASVDVIISNCVINLAPDKGPVFAEALRVLRPGGRLRVSDMVWQEKAPAEQGSADSWSACITGALPLQDYLQGLSSAGFAAARADAVRAIDPETGLASAFISAERL